MLLLVGIAVFTGVTSQLHHSFRGEVSYRILKVVGTAAYLYDLGWVLVPTVGVLVLSRRRIVGAVRVRVRVLDDVHARGGWCAVAVTGVLNAAYVLAFVGPGRWVATEAYTAYAVGSEYFLAADEVVAAAVVRYFDRGTALALVAIVVEAVLFQVVSRGRRRRGLAR